MQEHFLFQEIIQYLKHQSKKRDEIVKNLFLEDEERRKLLAEREDFLKECGKIKEHDIFMVD